MSDPRAFPIDRPDALASDLRDGLLQDLLAVSMLVERARISTEASAGDDARALDVAGATLRADIASMRALITQLRGDEPRCELRSAL